MNKMRNGTAMLLCALLVLLLLPVSALAASTGDLAGLKAAAKNGGIYTLASDITTDEVYFESYLFAGLLVEKDLTIDLNGHSLTITVPSNSSEFTNGIKVASGSTLTLEDSNPGASNKLAVNIDLRVTNTNGGAAINVSSGSRLVVNSGRIEATGNDGAGIGGGAGNAGGNITINGGTVTATSVRHGAGIGGGAYGDGGTITINGGTVTATSVYYGAGIGGGWVGGYGGNGGTVTISGGTVTATGGRKDVSDDCGAGIGGGDGCNGGTVYISGGSVKAIAGGDSAQDIGHGNNGNGGTLQNNSSEKTPVFLTTAILEPVSTKAVVTSLTAKISNAPYDYGIHDMSTDSSGKLYLYLPEGTTTESARTSSNYFTGMAITTNSYGTAAGTFALTSETARKVELRNNGTAVQWRYEGEGEDAWRDLVTLSSLTGADGADGQDGREIELRVDGGYIQWRYVGAVDWNNIVALSAITGPQGPAGADGTDGSDGREIELQNNGTIIRWRYVGETAWNDLVTIAALTGTDGTNGREIELRVDGGYIQWRYAGDTDWLNLMAVSVATGPQGPQGAQGAAGADGRNGRDGNDGADGLNGKDGSNGANGQNGKDGRNGNDGKGILSITKTGSEGNVDTYTISFTDGTSTTFTVTNGKDGVGVASAAFNENGELTFAFTDGTIINLGPLPASGGAVPASGTASGNNSSAGAAVPIAAGAASGAVAAGFLYWLLPLLKKILAARNVR